MGKRYALLISLVVLELVGIPLCYYFVLLPLWMQRAPSIRDEHYYSIAPQWPRTNFMTLLYLVECGYVRMHLGQ
jgi:hypothetical protein